ncbi:tyrosine-type recombinase/integrase [Desulfobacterales bacterium HSG17]|nr:tyrosine-type recombinase/integrase [Desulfobacterales bacterium HSG17]
MKQECLNVIYSDWNMQLPHLKAAIIIAFNTGMRMGEIRELKWNYIDQKAKMIRLPAKIVKEGKDKDIPINHHVVSAINTLPRAISGYVVTYKGREVTAPTGFKKSFNLPVKKRKYHTDERHGAVSPSMI